MLLALGLTDRGAVRRGDGSEARQARKRRRVETRRSEQEQRPGAAVRFRREDAAVALDGTVVARMFVDGPDACHVQWLLAEVGKFNIDMEAVKAKVAADPWDMESLPWSV